MINLERIGWENGTLISKGKVTIGGQTYDVEPAQYEGKTPVSAELLKRMEENTQTAITEVEEIATNNIITAFIGEQPSTAESLTKMTLTKSITVGNKLSISGGGIKIGSGIKNVLASGQITPLGHIKTDINIAIYKNDEQIARTVVAADAVQASAVVANKLIEVKEGDIIYLYYKGSFQQIAPGETLTFITVQAV